MNMHTGEASSSVSVTLTWFAHDSWALIYLKNYFKAVARSPANMRFIITVLHHSLPQTSCTREDQHS